MSKHTIDRYLFCAAYERALNEASGCDPDGTYYWGKFRRELYDIYYRFYCMQMQKAGIARENRDSKDDVYKALRAYVTERQKSDGKSMVRVEYRKTFGRETPQVTALHDVITKVNHYFYQPPALQDHLQERLAVMLICDPNEFTDIPGVGFRRLAEVFYLER